MADDTTFKGVYTLEASGSRVSGKQGASEILGVPATTLDYRMKRLEISRPS